MPKIQMDICQLIAAVTGASRVSWIEVDYTAREVRIIASTMGKPRVYDIKYDLPGVDAKHPIVLMPSIKREAVFRNHPLLELIPNLHSAAACFIDENKDFKTAIVAWNPNSSFFATDTSIIAFEHIVEIAKSVHTSGDVAIDAEGVGGHPTEPPHGLMEETVIFHSEPLYKFLFDTLVVKQRLLSRTGRKSARACHPRASPSPAAAATSPTSICS